jgi:hypothetical protein
MPPPSNRPRKKGALTPQEMKKLIEEYQIFFRGPLTPSQWPREYYDRFMEIRKAGSTEFDTLEDVPLTRSIKKRAIELVKNARSDRRETLRELALRVSVEPLVLHKFKKPYKW